MGRAKLARPDVWWAITHLKIVLGQPNPCKPNRRLDTVDKPINQSCRDGDPWSIGH